MTDKNLYRKNDYEINNYRKTELRKLNNIKKTMDKLDRHLEEIDKLNEKNNDNHELRKWAENRKAIHEIQHILNELGKYDKYAHESFNQAQDSYIYLNKQIFN